jgi:Transposase zinc-ribbon domain
MTVRRPVGGADYPRSQQEFDDWFRDEAACIEYLATLRWPAGFVCPTCGDDRSWRTAGLSWLCVACGRKTSVTSGTIFHRSHAPVATWLAAIWYVTSQRRGVSARSLQHALGLGSYETAWTWLQKLRRAMVRPERDLLVGTVEVDETVVVGNGGGVRRERTPVLVAVERMSLQRLGRVRLGVAGNGCDLLGFARQTVQEGSTIRVGRAAAPGVRLVASDLNRWMAGTLRDQVSRANLPYYLDEYTFRFDRRASTGRGLLFYQLLQQAVATEPHPRARLANGHMQ